MVCTRHCVMCNIRSDIYTRQYAICTGHYVLCILHVVMCILDYVMCTKHHLMCILDVLYVPICMRCKSINIHCTFSISLCDAFQSFYPVQNPICMCIIEYVMFTEHHLLCIRYMYWSLLDVSDQYVVCILHCVMSTEKNVMCSDDYVLCIVNFVMCQETHGHMNWSSIYLFAKDTFSRKRNDKKNKKNVFQNKLTN